MAIIRKKVKRASIDPQAVFGERTGASDVIAIAEKNGLATAPFDVKGVVRALDIRLSTKPLDDDVSGYLKKTESGWLIAVNSLHHPRRQKFTLAHELGHYFLHRHNHNKFMDKTLFRNGQTSSLEIEANAFASELLMPEDALKQYVNNVSKKVEDIAEYFGVSAVAVRYRAQKLGFRGHGL